MSPKKAKEQVRATFTAIREGVSTPSPVTSAMVDMYVDDRRVGCGFRRFVVLSVGRRWALLFHVPSLSQMKLDRRTFDTTARAVNYSKRVVTSLIRVNLKQAERLGMRHSPRAAKLALSAM